ncbi:MAG: putative Nudix hydrolase NudL [Pseudomonadota bacterium]|jgi:8-oxo-dGTP pyrophosphatase MutT (NUDIX family)
MKHALGFDPRDIPWSAQDQHWPALPPAALHAESLREVFKNPPVWTPEVKREPALGQRAPQAAAVLVPIVMRGEQSNEPHLLLTQRTQHLSSHAGQIAFPGGKVDPDDQSVEHAALREAEEEVGLTAEYVEVLGQLPSYITGTSFHITPVVALVSPNHTLQTNAYEVEFAFEVPLSFLMDPANHRLHQWENNGVQRQWYSMPYRPATTKLSNGSNASNASNPETEYFIWGATAGMIRNFYRFLLASNSL